MSAAAGAQPKKMRQSVIVPLTVYHTYKLPVGVEITHDDIFEAGAECLTYKDSDGVYHQVSCVAKDYSDFDNFSEAEFDENSTVAELEEENESESESEESESEASETEEENKQHHKIWIEKRIAELQELLSRL